MDWCKWQLFQHHLPSFFSLSNWGKCALLFSQLSVKVEAHPRGSWLVCHSYLGNTGLTVLIFSLSLYQWIPFSQLALFLAQIPPPNLSVSPRMGHLSILFSQAFRPWEAFYGIRQIVFPPRPHSKFVPTLDSHLLSPRNITSQVITSSCVSNRAKFWYY